MYCKLAQGVKLRGYRLVEHALYYPFSEQAKGLKAEEFYLLKKCGGQADLELTPLLESLLKRQIIVECDKGEGNEDWQEYRYCDNRYFPAAKISITGRCSFHCKHCFNAADNSPSTAELSKDEMFDLLAQLDECGVHRLEITGGEPLLHPAFMEIMREVARRHFNLTELLTTAHFLTEEILDELKSLGLRPLFKVSFDGIGYHDGFRGVAGAEERLKKNVALLVSKGFHVHIHTNVNKENLSTLFPTIQANAAMGAVFTEVLRTYEVPRPVEVGLPVLSMPEYYDFGLKTAEQYIKTNETMPLRFWQYMTIYPRIKTYRFGTFACAPKDYRDSLPVCRSNRGKLQIDHDGELWPCIFMGGWMKAHNMSVGNFREKRIQDILQKSDYLDMVTTTVGAIKEHAPECRDCEYWKVCAGGCRCLGMLFGDGDYLARDPAKCLFFREYLRPTIELFDKYGYICGNDLTGLPVNEGGTLQ